MIRQWTTREKNGETYVDIEALKALFKGHHPICKIANHLTTCDLHKDVLRIDLILCSAGEAYSNIENTQ